MVYGIFIGATLLAALISEVILSLLDGTFLPLQMRALYGPKGLAFFAHGGMHGDFFILPPLLGYIAYRYSESWPAWSSPVAFLLALVVSKAMHRVWLKNPIPDALVGNNGLTEVGQIHQWWYMPEALTVIFLFYGATPHPSERMLQLVAAALTVHVFLGTHAVGAWLFPSFVPRHAGSNMDTAVTILGCVGGLGLLSAARLHWYW